LGGALIAAGVVVVSFVLGRDSYRDAAYQSLQTNRANDYQVPAPAVTPVVDKEFPPFHSVRREGQVFARIWLPRLGHDYNRLVGQGTRWHPTLNEIGVGHYSNSAFPGFPGNVALAGHRGGFGGVFKNIHRFHAGDVIYVQTRETWFTYRYLQTKIVAKTDTNVISSVPRELHGAHKGGRYLTLTSCDPIFVNTNRIVAWFEQVSSQPLSQGSPF
jgi:sortase A